MRNTIFFAAATLAASVLAHPEPVKVERHDQGPAATAFPGNCEWTYQGCWSDPQGGRPLRNIRFNDDGMTVDKCLARCGDYEYAMVENHRYASLVCSIEITLGAGADGEW